MAVKWRNMLYDSPIELENISQIFKSVAFPRPRISTFGIGLLIGAQKIALSVRSLGCKTVFTIWAWHVLKQVRHNGQIWINHNGTNQAVGKNGTTSLPIPSIPPPIP